MREQKLSQSEGENKFDSSYHLRWYTAFHFRDFKLSMEWKRNLSISTV
ncbi:hypothetical protein LEP1GSC202_1291 [Leptospira yanagawae serovar Saopaulo str. Sao Paulo = ATCC 700523]|uniref:Uncharacterized protein n=1 Tax=Leptospira yanagawae serovar Saopaulo str. Sao Paulo = ATCC 700523 TaxID=1249483 RepID=A0A5E8HEX2_9LEPT|nr:hypothetical protein LEP1GSC202_1291 [Leptospira yanagawae serovar Saopaulo str. Sao Paulo = ATCC 700523]